jgi:hypothetical protein
MPTGGACSQGKLGENVSPFSSGTIKRDEDAKLKVYRASENKTQNETGSMARYEEGSAAAYDSLDGSREMIETGPGFLRGATILIASVVA